MSHLRRLLAVPALLAFALTDRRSLIEADVIRWAKIENRTTGLRRSMIDILAERPQFRNLLYHRLWHGNLAGKVTGRVCFVMLRREPTLYLNTDEIGPGLYLQHGFATIVGAIRIGANVWINQQVTIGVIVTDEVKIHRPVIEDGATIYAGAKVLGNVRVGRDTTIGANAVVTRDVPDGMVAVGVPAVAREQGRNARSRD
ncbi:MAG: serine acetyltransferase [Mycobacteriales bacterium]